MRAVWILQIIVLFTQLTYGQERRPYQIPYDRPELSVIDTVPVFLIDDYRGWFVSRILLLKDGKVLNFNIVRLELLSDSASYSYRIGIVTNQSKREDEHPDFVRIVYPAIDNLINNRLCVKIKDASKIYADTVSVIWGRTIGKK